MNCNKKIPVKSYVKKNSVVVAGYERSTSSFSKTNNKNLTGELLEGTGDLVDEGLYRTVLGQKIPLAGSGIKREKVGFVSIPPGTDLSGLDLRNMSFSRLGLSSVDFSGSDLRGSSFFLCDLSSVDFSGADLRGADFTYARANMLVANTLDFSDVNLTDAQISFSSLYPRPAITNTGEAIFSFDTRLSWVDLSGQDLRNWSDGRRPAKLYGADLRGANLEGVNLSKMLLSGSDLREANVQSSNLSEVLFIEVVADRANFSGSRFILARMEDCSMMESKFIGAEMGFRCFENSNFCFADFSNAKFYSTFVAPRVESCVMREANFTNSDLGFVWFGKSELSRGDLRESQPTDLRGAHWGGAKTVGIEIESARFLVGQGDNGEDVVEPAVEFEKFNFDEVKDLANLSDKQFEFFVLSGVFEVRDKDRHEIIKKQFNKSRHYVPVWSLVNSGIR